MPPMRLQQHTWQEKLTTLLVLSYLPFLSLEHSELHDVISNTWIALQYQKSRLQLIRP
jgi:hypothetical protein